MLPLMCPSPMFLLKGKLCSETQVLVSPALSFQGKGIALKIARPCFPDLLACCIRREVEDKRKQRGKQRHVKSKDRAACRPVARSDRLRSRPRTWFAHQIGAALRWLSSAGRRAVCGGLLSCLLQRSVAGRAAFLLRRPHRAGFLSGSISSFPRHLACQPDSQHKTGPKAPLASPQERGGARR